MSDFRVFLQQEFVRRCRQNPQYSLRAYARALGIHPATLSHILRGNRTITPATVKKVADRLGLSPEEIRTYSQAHGLPLERDFQQLSQDIFEVVSDWYHDAILELTRVRHFKPDVRWIARTLGITTSEVNIAVERLVRLELLEMTPKGVWIDRSHMNAVTGGGTTAARRKLQRQAIEKSLYALEHDPVELRDHSCITMAIQSTDLTEAKERVRKFRQELCRFLQRPGVTPDEVYQLSVGLYGISHARAASFDKEDEHYA